VIGLLGGAALGIIIALLLEMGDRRIRSGRRAGQAARLPLLGKIMPWRTSRAPERLLLTADAAEKV